MKFVHIADMHFDSPFVNLSQENNMREQRRLEQRQVFKNIIEYIKENNIDFFFIAGDLYEQKYIRKSTIEYINNLFKEIPNTKIYITPGNHDPLLKNSYYATYDWNKNVKIFNKNLEKIEEKENMVNIFGIGFEEFYFENSNIEELELSSNDLEKINILIMHADLDASSKEKEIMYNPVKLNNIKNKGFEYIALGHIHKRQIIDNTKEGNTTVIYPGSCISLGFDELGKHGMMVGEIKYDEIYNKNIAKYEFVELDKTSFKEIEIDVEKINYIEELIEKINELKIEDNEFIKIILIGNRKFEININKIMELNQNTRILKVKDNTRLELNKEEILKNTNSLKGIFLRKMLEKLEGNMSEEEKRKIEKAIEIGLDSF